MAARRPLSGSLQFHPTHAACSSPAVLCRATLSPSAPAQSRAHAAILWTIYVTPTTERLTEHGPAPESPFMAHTYRSIERQNATHPSQYQKPYCTLRSSPALDGPCWLWYHHPVGHDRYVPMSTQSHLRHKHSASGAVCKAKPRNTDPPPTHNPCVWGIPNPQTTAMQTETQPPHANAHPNPPSLACARKAPPAPHSICGIWQQTRDRTRGGCNTLNCTYDSGTT